MLGVPGGGLHVWRPSVTCSGSSSFPSLVAIPAVRTLTSACATPPAQRELQAADQRLLLGGGEPGFRMEREVGVRRHLSFLDRLGNVVGLLLATPLREVQRVASLVDVSLEHPGDRRNIAVPRPLGLVAVTVKAGAHGKLPRLLICPERLSAHRWVRVCSPVGHGLYGEGKDAGADQAPCQSFLDYGVHLALCVSCSGLCRAMCSRKREVTSFVPYAPTHDERDRPPKLPRRSWRRSTLCSSIATRIVDATTIIRPHASKSTGSTRSMSCVGGK